MPDELRQIRSYHRAHNVELELHSIGDVKTWRPVPARLIAWFALCDLGVYLVASVLLSASTDLVQLALLYVLAPLGLAWLLSNASVEGRRFHVVLGAASRYAFRDRHLAGSHRAVGDEGKVWKPRQEALRARRRARILGCVPLLAVAGIVGALILQVGGHRTGVLPDPSHLPATAAVSDAAPPIPAILPVARVNRVRASGRPSRSAPRSVDRHGAHAGTHRRAVQQASGFGSASVITPAPTPTQPPVASVPVAPAPTPSALAAAPQTAAPRAVGPSCYPGVLGC